MHKHLPCTLSRLSSSETGAIVPVSGCLPGLHPIHLHWFRTGMTDVPFAAVSGDALAAYSRCSTMSAVGNRKTAKVIPHFVPDVHSAARRPVFLNGAESIRAAMNARFRDSRSSLAITSFVLTNHGGAGWSLQKRKRNPAVVAMLLRCRKPLANPPFTCVDMMPRETAHFGANSQSITPEIALNVPAHCECSLPEQGAGPPVAVPK